MATDEEVREVTHRDIVAGTVNEFKTCLTERQSRLFPTVTALQAKKHIIRLQTSQERSKAILNFTRIRLFFDAFEQFDNICTEADLHDSYSSGYIWGPLQWIVQSVNEDLKCLDCVLELFYELGRKLPFLADYRSQLTEHPEGKKYLAYIYQDLLLRFYRKLLKLLESRAWRTTFLEKWKDYHHNDGPFQTLLASFDLHCQFITRLLDSQATRDSHNRSQEMAMQISTLGENVARHIDNYENDRRVFQDSNSRSQEVAMRINTLDDNLARHMDTYETDRRRIQAEAQAAEASRRHSQYNEVVRWLRSPVSESQADRHTQALKWPDQFPGTGSWILREAKLEAWMDNDTPAHSVLWLQGIPGAGKTVLSAIIIKHLQDHHSDANTSYFYCRESDSKLDESRVLSILKSLLRQLVGCNLDLLPTLQEKRLNGRNAVEILNDETTAKSILDLVCLENMKQYIVIDGLDELGDIERKTIVKYLSQVVETSDGYSPGKIRLLLVSRYLIDLKKMLQSEDKVEIYDITPEQTQNDIECYLDKQAKVLQHNHNLTEEDATHAGWLVSANSQGMFLYARLVMDNLMEQPNAFYVMAELRDQMFPVTLKDAYGRIIERLRRNENSWAEARKIFSWLICAKRALRKHEIQAVLSMDMTREGTLDSDPYKRLSKDIREVCGSLIQVVGETIEFIHQTAEEFIIAQDGQLDRASLECNITAFCLTYLSQPWFRADLDDQSRKRFAADGHYSFLDYAISRWDSHLMTVVEQGSDTFSNDATGYAHASRLAAALTGFANHHQSSFQGAESHEQEDISLAHAKCQPFQGYPFYDVLIFLCAHVLRQQRKPIKERSKISITAVLKVLEDSRKDIIALRDTDGSAGRFKELYGDRLHKCTRRMCAYFYEGFDNAEALENHSNRHERPFTCPESCSMVPFGFATNRDRDKHIRVYHTDQWNVQQSPATSGSTPPAAEGEGPRFKCDICGRRFTRHGILKDHMNSEHLGQRPYACSVCGREFVRRNDESRHYRNLHVRRRA